MDNSKVDRLIKYLRRLAVLKTKIIKNVESYKHVIWFHEIPKINGCYSKFHDSENIESERWIQVKYIPIPNLPDELKEYVSINENNEIQQSEEITDDRLKMMYDTFCNKLKQHQLYSKLYTIYQQKLRYDEKYELVICCGLLSWRSPKGNTLIKRHIVSLNAVIEYDVEKRNFTIQGDPQNIIKIETNFIPNEDLPHGFEQKKKDLLQEAEMFGIDSDEFKHSLEKFVYFLDPDGKYFERLIPNLKDYPKEPFIEYCPALIFRERSIGAYYDFLTRLLDSKSLRNPILKFFAEVEGDNNFQKYETRGNYSFSEIYLPKPYNKEQIRIIEKLKYSDVVLVQGPPGTGKSHTIANLICHLLAHDKRVLITSKSSRALQVLKNLIPERLRDLCVSILKEGREEKEELEKSVTGIEKELSYWDEKKIKDELKEKEEKLKEIKQLEIELTNKLKQYKEIETKEISIAGIYQGKPSDIAIKVREEYQNFVWFCDAVAYDENYPFYDINFMDLLKDIRYFNDEKIKNKLALKVPELEKLKTIEEMENLFKQEEELNKKLRELEPNANQEIKEILSNKFPVIQQIKDAFLIYKKNLSALSLKLNKWDKNIIQECFCSHTWGKDIEDTVLLTNEIDKYIEEIKDVEIDFLDINVPYKRILADAKALSEYLKNGGTKGWFIFKQKIIKEKGYLFEKVLINGNLCKNIEDLDVLCKYLDIEFKIEKVFDLWGNFPKVFSKALKNKHHYLREMVNFLREIDSLRFLKEKCLKLLNNEPIGIDFLNMADIENVINTLDLLVYKNQLNEIHKEIGNYLTYYKKFNIAPEIDKLIKSLINKDLNSYALAYEEIKKVHLDKKKKQLMDETINRIKQKLPELINKIILDPNNHIWDITLQILPEAWAWAQAKNWLENISSLEYHTLNYRLNNLNTEKRKIIEEIVKLKVLRNLMERMTEEKRKHMIAWQQSMKRLGKGTSKYIWKYRKDAQNHLDKIKDVIPAWIMPLYRIWDTIGCEKEIFDVLIFDEASQIGAEGISLLNLAKKVIIIGDDKQIIPEAVGIDRSEIFKIIEEFLYDFKFKDSFYIENSLFSYAELRYSSTKVFLREHFRCMPEIIRFCNELSYPHTPLIPLRQYSPERLNPLEKVYVPNAFCEGEGYSIRNEIEAQFIKNKIVELCKDKRYQGKTMGVIVLQGHAQADLIQRLLFESLSHDEIHKRKIICGNPYSFQGDERDIIFLSMVIAPNKERIGVMSDENDRRRFNVAVSRARDQVWLFHSVKIEDLSQYCLRRKLLSYFYNPEPIKNPGLSLEQIEKEKYYSHRKLQKPPEPFDSWFELDVAEELLKRGYYVIPQYKVGPYRIDLVVEGGYTRLAIECDGDYFHGVEQIEKDIDRERILRRCGWEFFRIRASDFYFKKEKILEKLERLLELNNIHPRMEENKKETKITMSDNKKDNKKELRIEIGDRVRYIDFSTPSQEREVLIVKGLSAPNMGIVNFQTPLAQALLGNKEGDIVEAHLPIGTRFLKILEIIR